jgi:hypothetical protein
MSMFHVRMCFLTLGRSAGRLNMRGHTHTAAASPGDRSWYGTAATWARPLRQRNANKTHTHTNTGHSRNTSWNISGGPNIM